MVTRFLNDVRYAFRTVRRSPTFALTAILTLAVMLAINVGVFATLNALAFRRLPAPRPQELVRLSTSFRTGQEVPFSFPMFRELAVRQRAVPSLIGSVETVRTIEAQGTLTRARVTGVTGNYFTELGVVPSAGRLLQPSDVNLATFTGTPVAVIGYGLWQRGFGGSPTAVGATVQVDGVPFTIAGVAPRGFKGFALMTESDVIVPITVSTGGAPPNYAQAGLLWMRIAGRLGSGISLEQARAQLEAVWPAIKGDIIPPTHAGAQRENFLSLPLRLDSLATGHEPYLQGFRGPLFVLQGLALLALLIGCLNLASLTLRRLTTYAVERAVRTALGASPWQAVRHVLLEGVLLAVAGTLLAVPVGLWASALITRMILPTSTVPLSLNTSADARVLVFTAALGLVGTILFGLLPAYRSIRTDPQDALRTHTRAVAASGRLLRVVVVAQLALSVILLTNAGLLTRSLQRILTVNPGFARDGAVVAPFTTRPGIKERPDDAAYLPALIERVEAIAEVERASIVQFPPGSPGGRWIVSPMSWEPTEGLSAVFNSVTPGLFETLGVPIVVGRDFQWADHAQATRVAILSRSLASSLFRDRNPLGERIRIGTQPYRQDLEIVGVVADARLYDVKDGLSYAAYIADLQNAEPTPGGWLVMRGSLGEATLQEAVQSVGPDFVLSMEPLTNAFSTALASDRVTALLAAIFAGATLLLAAVGVGGLFAYSVGLRRKEIAIRVALGGNPKRIAQSILREGLQIALFGTVLGALVSLVAIRPLRPLLFGIGAYDPTVLIGVPLMMAAVVACACLIPALRAASVDPAVGLRVE